MASSVSYPTCCGLNIIKDFYANDLTPDGFLVWHNRVTKAPTLRSCASLIAALNDGQNALIGEEMKKLGWNCILNGAHNSLHNSKIYLYAFVFRPEKSNPDVLSPDY